MKHHPPNPPAFSRSPQAKRAGRTLMVAIACLVGSSGCTVCQQARRTFLNEPAQFAWKKDPSRSVATYLAWADAEWRNHMGACAGETPSSDYAAGFRDGFVDYTYAGGSGEPPPVPPRKFWNVAWRSPLGHAAAADWYAGYRHGAQVSRTGGYRQQTVVQTSALWQMPAGWPAQGGVSLAPYEEVAAPTPAPPVAAPSTPLLQQPPGVQDTLPAPPVEKPASPAKPADDDVASFTSALRRAAVAPAPKVLPAAAIYDVTEVGPIGSTSVGNQ